ncbi:hypothetical protein [Aquitalea aquatilis]|uniref:hypothetical protein n=1 Tax=Aquitalea aquatilis TaxID=1537400 RepID=UPI0010BD7EEB|nr:hypothetical protein [Aquitalea aquatilis]
MTFLLVEGRATWRSSLVDDSQPVAPGDGSRWRQRICHDPNQALLYIQSFFHVHVQHAIFRITTIIKTNNCMKQANKTRQIIVFNGK